LSELSKTFKEAIHIATQLGLQYIWIDSLCIVQDDAEDWAREAVQMSDVYGNSFINIAAGDSEDGRGGCFL
ncbi:heterokaryon incompatibility, partial [Cadophora sp. DSE1049]